MRILMIAATYPPTRCGVGDYVRRVGHELHRVGEDVFVLTGEAEDLEHDHGDPTVAAVGARPAPRRIETLRFDTEDHGVRLSRQVPDWRWGALDWIDAALREVRPDVVSLQFHGEDYLLHPAVCAVGDLAREHGRPVVTTLHNLQRPVAWSDPSDPLEHLLRSSAAWICTNAIDEARLRSHEAADRLHVIPTGPCITDDRGRRTVGADGPLRIGYFGFLNPFKGIEYLLRAAADLYAEGRAIHVELAAGIHTDAPGRLREYARFVDDEIERLGIAPVLERHGYVTDEEVGALLGRSHVAVFPFRDGLSGKNSSFWSTMHHATPTLTTRGPGLPSGLVDGENTMLVPTEDHAAIAERLRWADTHRAGLEAIGRAGRDFVVRSFDWSVIARSMHEVFASAVASHPARTEESR